MMLLGITQSTTSMGKQHIQADGVENTLDIQVHDLRKRAIGMGIELLPPRSPRIRK